MLRLKPLIKKDKSYTVWKSAGRKILKNIPAMVGLTIIVFTSIVALFGANLRMDDTEHANNAIPPIQQLKPGSSVQHILLRSNNDFTETGFFGKLLMGGSEKIYKYYPILSYDIKGTEVVYEAYSKNTDSELYEPRWESLKLPDILYSLDYLKENNIEDNGNGSYTIHLLDGTAKNVTLDEMVKTFKEDHLVEKTYFLGTDLQGRDLLSRIMAGAIVSLGVGLISVTISLVIGLVLGMLAGFYRGWVDEVVMYLVSVLWSIPALILLISFVLVFGKGFTTVFIGLGMLMWVDLARLVRGQVLSVREREYIEAGRALGFNDLRILTKHVIPNIIGPVIVICATNFANAILLEAGLSYLGIGTKIPMASWGTIMKNHGAFFNNADYSYMAILPGICIIILVFSFMMLGNGLRDAFDAKEK